MFESHKHKVHRGLRVCPDSAAFGIGFGKAEADNLIQCLHLDVGAHRVAKDVAPTHSARIIDAGLDQAACDAVAARFGPDIETLHLASIRADPAQCAPAHRKPRLVTRDPGAALRRQVLVGVAPEVLDPDRDIEGRIVQRLQSGLSSW